MFELTDLLRAVIMGIIQAVTEFLPVSSSGHLVVMREFVHFDEQNNSLTFDVALHVGTSVAVILFFWRDWQNIFHSVFYDIADHGLVLRKWNAHSLLLIWIVIATIPVVVVGFIFQDLIEQNLRQPLVVGVSLIVFGLLIGLMDRLGESRKKLEDIHLSNALWIGIFQAISFIPGVSRSGMTIGAARMLGFDRVNAARFSFLLSTPAVIGASLLRFFETQQNNESINFSVLIAGSLISCLVGIIVIRFLLRYLQNGTLWPFVWYRIVLGLLVIAYTMS